jgi:hypothetical protein
MSPQAHDEASEIRYDVTDIASMEYAITLYHRLRTGVPPIILTAEPAE